MSRYPPILLLLPALLPSACAATPNTEEWGTTYHALGFASRILLPDRRLLPSDEGRALVFQSKLVKPVSSGLSIKKEKQEKKYVPKQKTRAQAIEDMILAEESAKVAASRPQPPKEASPQPAPVAAPEPEPELQVEPEPVREPEPEPPKEPTPPPAETKTKPKKEIKKKSSLKSSAPLIEAEAIAVDSPPVAEVPVEQTPIAEELKAAEESQPSEPILAPEPVAEPPSAITPEPESENKEVVATEPVEEAPTAEATEQPAEPIQSEPEPIQSEPEIIQPVENETVLEPVAATLVSEEVPQVESSVETTAQTEIDSELLVDPEPEVQKTEEATIPPDSEQENETETSNISIDEKYTAGTNEDAPATVESESTVAEPSNDVIEPHEDPEIATPPTEPVTEGIKVEQEELTIVEDPTSRLEGEVEPASAADASAADASAEEEAAEIPVQEPAESEKEIPTSDDPQISEVVESPSSENLPETTEPIIEEPTTPVTEQ